MLTIYSILIGENPNNTKHYQVSSKRKITLLANVLLVPVLMWTIMGFLVSKVVLEQPITTAIITAIILGFLIFLIERSILMASGNPWLIAFRITLGLVTALLGSVGIDEVIFKNDIDKKMAEYKRAEIKKAGKGVGFEYLEAIKTAQKEKDTLYKTWQFLKIRAQREADGSGGTRTLGYKEVAKMKEKDAKQAYEEYKEQKSDLAELKAKLDVEKLAAKTKAEGDFNDHALLIRIKALFDLVKSDQYMAIVYFLVTFFLFLLEFIVVIIKTTTKNSIDEDKEITREAMLRHNLTLLKQRKEQYEAPEDLLPQVQDTKSLIRNHAAAINLL